MLEHNEDRVIFSQVDNGVPQVDAPQVGGDTAGILDAVADQLGGHWIRYGTTSQLLWFSLRDLQVSEKDVFSRLSGPSMTFLTSARKNAFKKEVEGHSNYRPALVAAHPGWLGSHYIFGDGTSIAPLGDTREVIIAFERSSKFRPQGTLRQWQKAVGPIVANQPLPLFVLAFAFIGPLLRFAPSHIVNPQVELVGRRECGKSTLVALAASIWAGDPDCDVGGGETWDMTINAPDPQKPVHADNLLVLDEGNLAGTTGTNQKETIRREVFKIAATGGGRRYTDAADVPNVRLAMLSTSNVALGELVQAGNAVSGALQSRMITLQISDTRAHGVLAALPEGYSDSREAIEHLRCEIDKFYGTAGRTFMKRLIAEVALDEGALRRKLERRINRFLSEAKNEGVPWGSARALKAFAITFAAGSLARNWGILPKNWGHLRKAILQVCSNPNRRQEARSPGLAFDQVLTYYREHRKRIVRAADLKTPCDTKTFKSTAGFLRLANGRKELLIPSTPFQRSFPDHARLMKALKEMGLTRTEGGERPKLTIETPKSICATGRVYCILLN